MGKNEVRRTKNIRNIGIYHPHVFQMRYGFIRGVLINLHMEVKGGIFYIRVKLIKSIKSNQIMDYN